MLYSFNDYDERQYKELKNYEKIFNSREVDMIDSNFESGNLYCAYKSLSELEYYLILEKDINTYGYNNWFFFRLRNKEEGVRRFHIINIVKKTSLYRQGMKIAIFSMNKYAN